MTGVGATGKIMRVPNQPKTPVHGFRIPDQLHADAKYYAALDGETLSDVVRSCLDRYVKRKRREHRQRQTDS